MGINKNGLKFLAYAASSGVSCDSTLMLGRQNLFVTKPDIDAAFKRFSLRAQMQTEPSEYAEPLLAALGAKVIDSMDYSGFEQASVLHDLNDPVPTALHGKYSVVFDGGTLEHVYNFPVAIRSCMEMLKVGGHFLSVTPANNFCGHGFYQFSPELFFSLFGKGSGFEVKLIALALEDDVNDTIWYRVTDPSSVRMRVTLSSSLPTTMMVIAKKTSEVKNNIHPFQSDYKGIWFAQDPSGDVSQGRAIRLYRRWTPKLVRNLVGKILRRNVSAAQQVPGLGYVDPRFFSKMDI